MCHIARAFNATEELTYPPAPVKAILIFHRLDSNAKPKVLPPIWDAHAVPWPSINWLLLLLLDFVATCPSVYKDDKETVPKDWKAAERLELVVHHSLALLVSIPTPKVIPSTTLVYVYPLLSKYSGSTL